MKRILIIEDNPDISHIYSEKLKFAGFDVTTVGDGKTGLVEAHANPPDIILLDIMLPNNMNGFDVLEEIKKDKDLKKIPVIMLTNLDTEKKTALNIGATDYIIKASLQLQELVDKVKKYC
jgi:DNA-binding response OmpR family regulator